MVCETLDLLKMLPGKSQWPQTRQGHLHFPGASVAVPEDTTSTPLSARSLLGPRGGRFPLQVLGLHGYCREGFEGQAAGAVLLHLDCLTLT